LLSLLEAAAAIHEEAGKRASMAVVEHAIRRGQMPPLHTHEEDEAFYVLEGTMTVYAGDETVRIAAGERFVARKGVPHTHRADSDQVRYLAATVARSVGRYEDFLRAVAVPRPHAESSVDETATVTSIARTNGIAVLGPPGALPAA
jgi:quercetin dioxygenase-like cupin family protein